MDCQSNWPWEKVHGLTINISSTYVTCNTENRQMSIGNRCHSLDIILVSILNFIAKPTLSKHRQAFQVKGTDKAYLLDTAT